MCDEKRKRSPNWLPSEKKLLLNLVEKHYNIVENKKTDGVSVKAKLAEWQIIAMEYNSQTTHCPRQAENLKGQWENMKKAAKKESAHARMQRIQTGGGPPDPKKEDPVYSRILSLITTSAVGLYNQYDNDCLSPMQPDSEIVVVATDMESENLPSLAKTDTINEFFKPLSVIDTNMNASTSMDIGIKDCVLEKVHPLSLHPSASTHSTTCEIQKGQEFIAKDWGDYTPQLLKTPISAPLKKGKMKTEMSRRRPLHTSSSSLDVQKEKIKSIHLQMELAVEEAEYKKKKQAQLDIELKKESLKQAKIKTRQMLLELRKKKKYKENLRT